ncbi:carboxylic ester hydrolase-32 [Coleophoma cylindrospora]|uniref:Carboxylic ester hydrolase n=1 Tax=Coleophoma cylindrospora TaxID=1849047 RepID=A0A3D8QDX2_9HELO|nr:carboxylic ester hydrolase-32 [Coleophoma cylindrospora]
MGNTLSAYKKTEHVVNLADGKGAIRGVQYGSKARRYTGVPYALPPTGERRWRKPCPLPESHIYSDGDGSPFEATEFGPICAQALNYTSANKHVPTDILYNEDCLRLNIWTPVQPAADSKEWPVMLWLHGGWFQMGDPSHEPGMDPTELISTGKLNAIVVAIGYRLNLFGFLAGQELRAESETNEVGNYGLWDQRLAIEWVHQNISSFGGDPENVTLAGRSAGAYAVHAHALYEFQNPAAQATPPKFQRLVMMSNAIPTQPKTPDDCQEQFDELCSFFNFSTLPPTSKMSALRSLTTSQLVDAIMQLKHHTFRPITDSSFILPDIMSYHRSGAFARAFQSRGLKLFIGEMLNEETLYAATNSPEGNLDSLRLQVTNYYAPGTTDRILRHYELPKSSHRQEWISLYGRIIADGQVRAPSRFLANSLFEHGVSLNDIWRYRISYRLSFITDKVAPSSFGVAHAMDKPFWNFSIMHGPTDKERVLMERWIRDLVAFVNNESGHEYGTKSISEFKVATPEGGIEIQEDKRWLDLLQLSEVFFGDESRS